MARPENCIDWVLSHEVDGFGTSHEAKSFNIDQGGPTKYGITIPFLKEWGPSGDKDHDGNFDIEDIRALLPDDARAAVKSVIWDKCRVSSIASDLIARKWLDVAVNGCPSVATRVLQRACNAILPMGILKDDGILGPKTILSANSLMPHVVIEQMRHYQKEFYLAVLRKHPEYENCRKGWLNRAAR